jgi:hypothetical protein
MASGFWKPLDDRPKRTHESKPEYMLGCVLLLLCVVLVLGASFAAGYMLGNFNKQQEIHHVNL